MLTSGCIREDNMEDCDTCLYFSYLGDFNKEIFPEKIKKVNLYVYNETGILVETILLDREDLSRTQGTMLNLPAGNYHLVCWGNANQDTQINDHSAVRSAIVAAPHYFTKEIISTNDSLYIGNKDLVVTGNGQECDTVYFTSSHIKMKIELVGLDNSTDSPIDIQIGNLSPTVDFANNFSTENVTYYPGAKLNTTTGSFESDFNVLRYNDDNDVYINLVNKETGQVIYTLNLKDFMTENQVSVDGINEAFVGVRFRFNGLSVIVKPWDEENIIPGM